MKNLKIFSFFALFFCLAFLSCNSTAVEKDESVQKLLKEGRYEEAKGLFITKTDINAQDKNGDTALHVCARINEADLIAFFAFKNAGTEIENADGDTPLLVAVKNDNIESAKILIQMGANIFAKDASENSALQLALAKNELWYEVMITEKTGQIRAINGDSIVHYFVRTDDEKAIDFCIKKQLPLSVKNNEGDTPLSLCYKRADETVPVRIAAALLQAGCECERGDFAYFEDSVRTHNTMLRFADGQTPLHFATILGHTGIVNYFLNEKTPVRISDILQAQDIAGSTPLHEAVRYGRVEIAKILLDAGAKVDALDAVGKSPFLLIIPAEKQLEMYNVLLSANADVTQKDMYGDTVLHVCTMAAVKTDVLSVLINHGAPVNERNKKGVTPLSLAIEKNNTEHVIFYARAGADINAEDMEGNTPLTRALESPSIDMLKTLITPQNVLSKDSAGNTPLHIALIKGSSFGYIKFLVETGADVNARNKDGDSVLFLAVRKNKKDVGDLLLSKNADIFASNTENNSPLRIALAQGGEVQDWLITSQTLNASDGSGNTPLHYACEWKLDEAVSALIQKGANVNAVNANGESALFAAVKADSSSTINILVENGIITDTRSNLTRDHLGNTPLHYAVKWNSLQAAQSVISLGFDVNSQNLSGKTALSDCCRSDKRQMAVLLIQNGANVNSTDVTGRSVLVDAIQSGNEEMVNLLLEKGANPLIQEMNGRNSFHEAALGGNIKIIELIRSAGGNPLSRDTYGDSPFSLVLNYDENVLRAVLGTNLNIVDSDGNTPIHIAVEKKVSAQKLDTLIKMGYPVSQRNGKGVTPLNMAITTSQKSLALTLIERGADPFAATITGDNALTNAFKNGNVEILDAICKYNARKTDTAGDSILHYAARLANDVQVRHLLELGLDRTAKNLSGETPSKMAARWNRPAIAELLK
ncbi:ankyrin repeat domain-containing protein [Treponema sp. UBA7570]|uniref:ankyrin repeat domain-containing protein n=1 Tax=Treponema sp. UBA7570 TaxID=1947749 RepID=UPI0025F81991|nr:ankyrin repeat domain-containing protein [Treponema sp. UBA7570]